MGKYFGLVKTEDGKSQEECHPNALRLYLLAGIADELAEANRLKRLELCFLQVTSGLPQETIDDVFDHDRELEDQA